MQGTGSVGPFEFRVWVDAVEKVGDERSEAHVLELFFKVGFPRALAAAPERDR